MLVAPINECIFLVTLVPAYVFKIQRKHASVRIIDAPEFKEPQNYIQYNDLEYICIYI